jgi:hypothetical protein
MKLTEVKSETVVAGDNVAVGTPGMIFFKKIDILKK